MSDVIKFPNEENTNKAIINPELEEILDHLDITDYDSVYNNLNVLLSMEDDKFQPLSETFLLTFEDTLNKNKQVLRLYAQDKDYTKEDFEITLIQIKKEIAESELSPIKQDFLLRLSSLIFNLLLENDDPSHKFVAIPYELCRDVEVPSYANEGDAGMDIYAPDDYTIAPGETLIIPTGIKVAIPQGYALLIQPRSGQSVKTKLRVANTPGLIDSGYRDEIGVIIENIEPQFKDIDYEFNNDGTIKINSILHGNTYSISKGQRFAQMRLVEAPMAALFQVNNIHEIEGDRGGGFGSSGIS